MIVIHGVNVDEVEVKKLLNEYQTLERDSFIKTRDAKDWLGEIYSRLNIPLKAKGAHICIYYEAKQSTRMRGMDISAGYRIISERN